jgi:hypothetical protein
VLWVGFALLSLKSVYAIPFLAVVTVPLVASRLNVFSGRVTLGAWDDRRTRVALFGSGAGRVLSVLVLLGLCVAAYPGWLHPPGWQTPAGFNPAYARRVAWAVEPDPTLAAAATRIDGWRASGKLPDDTRGLITSVELANYCAWYAPREKVFVNGRFNHHRPELPQFVKVRRGLGLIWGDELPDPKDVAAVLDARDIGYVGIATAAGESESSRATAQVAGRQTWVGWENWAPWYIDGRTTISGWRPGPGKGGPAFDRLRVDPAVLAFGPGVKKLPAGKVEPLPPPRTLLDDFTHPVRPGPPDAEDAPAWVQYRQVVANRQAVKGQVLQLMLLRVVPRIGGPPLPAEAISANTQGQFAQAQPGAEIFAPWPPPGAVAATPVLALRAARRAIAANPDHPDGYFALAVALEDQGLPISDGERTTGIVTAFRQCLSRMPPPAEYRRGVYAASPTQVSARLAELYLGRQLRDGTFGGVSVDLPVIREMIGEMVTLQNNQIVRFQYQPAPGALGPFVQALDLARTALAQARDYAAVEVPPEKREETVKNLAENLKKLDAVLIGATRVYQAAAQQSPAARYRVARRAGLTGEAITLLKELIAKNELEAQFKQDTQRVALELIALELATGRLEDAADDIEGLKEVFTTMAAQPNPHPDLMLLRGTLRYMEYHKLVLEGNYAGAGAEFEELNGGGVGKYPTGEGLKARDLAGLNPRALDPRPYLIFGPAWPVIGSLGTTDSLLGLLVRHQAGYVQVLRQMAVIVSNRMREDAEFFFRRGFLSLLEGDMPAAKERFRQATRPPPPGWDVPTVSHAVAADYLRVIEAAEQRAAAP